MKNSSGDIMRNSLARIIKGAKQCSKISEQEIKSLMPDCTLSSENSDALENKRSNCFSSVRKAPRS